MNAFLYATKDSEVVTLFFRELSVTPKTHGASKLHKCTQCWSHCFHDRVESNLPNGPISFFCIYLLNQLLERGSVFPHWRTIKNCRKLSALKIITMK